MLMLLMLLMLLMCLFKCATLPVMLSPHPPRPTPIPRIHWVVPERAARAGGRGPSATFPPVGVLARFSGRRPGIPSSSPQTGWPRHSCMPQVRTPVTLAQRQMMLHHGIELGVSLSEAAGGWQVERGTHERDVLHPQKTLRARTLTWRPTFINMLCDCCCCSVSTGCAFCSGPKGPCFTGGLRVRILSWDCDL